MQQVWRCISDSALLRLQLQPTEVKCQASHQGASPHFNRERAVNERGETHTTCLMCYLYHSRGTAPRTKDCPTLTSVNPEKQASIS